MHKLILVIVCWGCWMGAEGQLYDKTWICGSYASKVTFQAQSIDTLAFNPHVLCRNQWACISDANGNFQFFTEGVNVYSHDGSKMANGDSLADSSVNSYFKRGLPDYQNVLILPKKDNQYYIIYQSVSDQLFATLPWYYTDRLYYSLVDMNLQNGKGEVTEKRVRISSGSFMDGKLTACQHANGIDWWLVQRGHNNNRYFIYLITPDAITFVGQQNIGAVSQEPDAVGQSAFSPDGSMYATITGNSQLIILDFDRCSGLFSNPQQVNIPLDTFMFFGQQKISGGGGNGLCFSPDNRYLYINTMYVLRQYDLLANPIDSSGKEIFFWTDTIQEFGLFGDMYIGPNGKIYLAPYQGISNALHVINNPDSNGLACGFVKWGLPFPTDNANQISNMVHFRMGSLPGSPCDTLTTAITPKSPNGDLNSQIQVYPNPSSDHITIDYAFIDWSKGDVSLEITNGIGQIVFKQMLPKYSGLQQIDVSQFASGVYMASIKRHAQVVTAAKFSKH